MRISDWSSDVCSSDLWGSKGLGGFNRGDLAEDLGDDQIRAVLGLFGSDMVAYAPPSRAAGIGIDRTGLTGISDLERRYTRFYRSEEHTSELQSLMRISYAVFCLKTKNTIHTNQTTQQHL